MCPPEPPIPRCQTSDIRTPLTRYPRSDNWEWLDLRSGVSPYVRLDIREWSELWSVPLGHHMCLCVHLSVCPTDSDHAHESNVVGRIEHACKSNSLLCMATVLYCRIAQKWDWESGKTMHGKIGMILPKVVSSMEQQLKDLGSGALQKRACWWQRASEMEKGVGGSKSQRVWKIKSTEKNSSGMEHQEQCITENERDIVRIMSMVAFSTASRVSLAQKLYGFLWTAQKDWPTRCLACVALT